MQEELQKRGSTEADLAARRKGEGVKLKLAVRLRAETIMTLKWIAAWRVSGFGGKFCQPRLQDDDDEQEQAAHHGLPIG